MNENEMKVDDIRQSFVVRPCNEEANEYFVTLGDQLASKRTFKTKEEAEAELDRVPWDMCATIAYTMAKAVFNKMFNEKTEEQK